MLLDLTLNEEEKGILEEKFPVLRNKINELIRGSKL